MVTTRTPIGRPPKSRITAEAVQIYKRVRAAEGKPRKWEQAHSDRVALHAMIGRQIWEYSIWGLDLDAETPPDWVIAKGDIRVRDWYGAVDLRNALEAALKA